MTVSTDSFVKDFREFRNADRYSPSMINYWGAVANLLLNNPRVRTFWDMTPGGFLPPPQPPTLSVVSGGTMGYSQSYAVLTYTTPNGETTQSGSQNIYVPEDYLLQINSPVQLGIATGWNIYAGVELGVYYLQNPAPLPLGTAWVEPTTGILLEGSPPPEFNTSGNKTLMDIGVELFIAHNLALEAQAEDAAAINAVPGTVGGAIVARGAQGISITYDANNGIEKNAGHWNLTTYGRRLYRLFRIVGAVPLQIGIGFDPTGGMNGPGWAGPPPFVVGSPGSAVY